MLFLADEPNYPSHGHREHKVYHSVPTLCCRRLILFNPSFEGREIGWVEFILVEQVINVDIVDIHLIAGRISGRLRPAALAHFLASPAFARSGQV